MSRPSDWHVIDLSGDPTPGESSGVRTLAREYRDVATAARSAETVLRRVQSSGTSAVWVGAAAEVFRDGLEDFPENIGKCAASFGIVSDAIYSWATSIDSWQTQADTNLNKARLAKEDIATAQTDLASAQSAASSIQGELTKALRTYNMYQHVEPPSGVKVPTSYQISQLRHKVTGATNTSTGASTSVEEAQERFDAARSLVLQARDEFEAAAKLIVGKIEEAKDAGLEADSWWEKVYHSEAWQALVVIATAIVIVAAIASFFVTGPLLLAITATAIVGNGILNVDDIASFAAGDMSLVEFTGAMAMALVPGGRAMKSLNEATDAAKAAARSTNEAADTVSSVTRRVDDGATVPLQLNSKLEAPTSPRAPGAVDAEVPQPDGSIYTNHFQMKLDESDWRATRKVHFARANAALDEAMRLDAADSSGKMAFTRHLESISPSIRSDISSIGGRQNPDASKFIWHHAHPDTVGGEHGIMQLVPKPEHTPGSAFWRTMHPGKNGGGGFSIWGGKP